MPPSLIAALARALKFDPDHAHLQAVSGGSIAEAYCLTDGRHTAFIKCLPADQSGILYAEADGLRRIADTQTVATPQIIGYGRHDRIAWLALSWIEMRPLSDSGNRRLGEQLAALHRCQSDRFGLSRDNFIGRTPQINPPESDWTTFFFEQRIGVQLRLLDRNHPGHPWEARLAALQQRWIDLFSDYQPQPSLLHGDLWSGNAAQSETGQPVVFDPAVHYGDRECDLAMADLFGGFSRGFYDAYARSWPLEPGWPERRPYYQLYHLLNHANLFAGHYLSTCRNLMDELTNR